MCQRRVVFVFACYRCCCCWPHPNGGSMELRQQIVRMPRPPLATSPAQRWAQPGNVLCALCSVSVSLVASCRRILRVLFETSNTHKQHKFCNLCARGYCFHFPCDALGLSARAGSRAATAPAHATGSCQLPPVSCPSHGSFAETISSLCMRLQTPLHCCFAVVVSLSSALPVSLTLGISTLYLYPLFLPLSLYLSLSLCQ